MRGVSPKLVAQQKALQCLLVGHIKSHICNEHVID